MNPSGALNLETRRTFSAIMPEATHYEPATCEQVGCKRRAEGFAVLHDTTRQADRDRLDWIYANPGGRQWYKTVEGGITRLDFPPGNDCFEQHRRMLDKPAMLVDRKGSHTARGVVDRLPIVRRHTRGSDFMEDLREHTSAAIDQHRKG